MFTYNIKKFKVTNNAADSSRDNQQHWQDNIQK
jgi:hypothetical protein